MWFWGACFLFRLGHSSPFISAWRTTTINESIALPFSSQTNTKAAQVDIDWGDGNIQHVRNGTRGPFVHSYAQPQAYTTQVTGEIRGWACASVYCTQLINITQWGDSFIIDNSSQNWFAGASNLTTISAYDQPVFVYPVSLEFFFYSCLSLVNVSLNWNISGVTSLHAMFDTVPLFNSPINFTGTENVTDLTAMFFGASSFNSPVYLDNTDNVVSTFGMFYNCSSFNFPLNFSFPSATTFEVMFYNCSSFNSYLNFSNTVSLVTISHMFENAQTYNQITQFYTGNVTNMSGVFLNCNQFNSAVLFITSRVSSMVSMFQRAHNYNLSLSFDTSAVEDMASMFEGAFSLNSELFFTNVSRVISLNRMFCSAYIFNRFLPFLNTSTNVQTLNQMFMQASSYNQPLYFQTNSLIETQQMFAQASSFNSPVYFLLSPLNQSDNSTGRGGGSVGPTGGGSDSGNSSSSNSSGSNSSIVSGSSMLRNVTGMFQQALSYNQPLFFTCEMCEDFTEMFDNAVSFNQKINFTKTRATTTRAMFYNCYSFNSFLYIDTSLVTDMSLMFWNCSSLNISVVSSPPSFIRPYQAPNISTNNVFYLDTSQTLSMGAMFLSCYHFTANLKHVWNVPLVAGCGDFCPMCGLPDFHSCSVCSPTVYNSLGYQVCNCPLGETLMNTTNCAVVTTAPSFAPTSSAPTSSAPTGCPACQTVINNSGANTTQTVVVGDPKSSVSVQLPPSIFSNPNVTVRVIISPLSQGPPVPLPPGGNVIVSIDILDLGVVRNGSTQLTVPISFIIPYSLAALTCVQNVKPQCVWWNGTGWANSGCVALPIATGTQCTCSHLTDFAVLLEASLPCSNPHPTDVYVVFVAVYALLLLYCVITTARLLRMCSKKDKYESLFVTHVLVGGVSVLRIVSCARFFGAFTVSAVLTAFVTAAPYPLEFYLFTRLAATWASLVHFSLTSASVTWLKIRPVFWVLNVLGAGLAVALFVIFTTGVSFDAAVGGTTVLAIIYISLAITFHIYTSRLVRDLNTTSGSGLITERCGASFRIKWVGRITTYCFVLQAVSDIAALATPANQLEFWTALFLLSNVLALGCLMFLYSAGVAKAASGRGDRNTRETSGGSKLSMRGLSKSASEL